MEITYTKRFFKYPFYSGKLVRDYESGQPVFNAPYYAGPVVVNGALFETWIDNDERNWRCINPNYKLGNRA